MPEEARDLHALQGLDANEQDGELPSPNKRRAIGGYGERPEAMGKGVEVWAQM